VSSAIPNRDIHTFRRTEARVKSAPTLSVVDLAPFAEAIDVEALSAHLTDVMLDEVYRHVVQPELIQPLLVEATTEKLGCLANLIAARPPLSNSERHQPLRSQPRSGVRASPSRCSSAPTALVRGTLERMDEHRRASVRADRRQVGDVVRASIPLLFGFVDRMLCVSLVSYHEAVAARHQTLAYRRARLVEQLLDGTLTEAGIDTERFIGYAFAHHHLAAVLESGDWSDDRQLAAELKRAAQAPDLLVLDRNGASTQLWLGLRAPITLRSARHSRRASRRPATGSRSAKVKPGLRGFRASASTAGRRERAGDAVRQCPAGDLGR